MVGDPATLGSRLTGAGIAVRVDGALLHVDVEDEGTYDVVRDAVAELGLGLVRMERQRHRMSEIFTAASDEEATRV